MTIELTAEELAELRRLRDLVDAIIKQAEASQASPSKYRIVVLRRR
jgi:hypothetical protein